MMLAWLNLKEPLINQADLKEGIINNRFSKEIKRRGTRLTLILSLLSEVNRIRQNKFEEFVKFLNGDPNTIDKRFFIATANIVGGASFQVQVIQNLIGVCFQQHS